MSQFRDYFLWVRPRTVAASPPSLSRTESSTAHVRPRSRRTTNIPSHGLAVSTYKPTPMWLLQYNTIPDVNKHHQSPSLYIRVWVSDPRYQRLSGDIHQVSHRLHAIILSYCDCTS
eukprot:scaffold2372_cov158-Amphora_coffeaeformis.AAC.4